MATALQGRRWSGMRLSDGGERVVSVTVNGEPLDEQAHYKLATSDFLARGGVFSILIFAA